MKHIDINQFNCWAKNHIFDDSKFDSDSFIISENNTHFKSTGSISRIFEDHWKDYYLKYSKAIDTLKPNSNKNVTFYYSDHTNEEYHEETNSAFEFMTKILRHLLPENFKSIRSYGFYNKSSKLCDNIKYVISREKIRIKRELLKWRNLILTSFNRIPIICPFCGEIMETILEVS